MVCRMKCPTICGFRMRKSDSMIGLLEYIYLSKHFHEVKHVTLNPGSEGVVRVHMIPPKLNIFRNTPSVLLLNGQDILPINISWAILLSAFIDELQPYDQKELTDGDWDGIIQRTINKTKRVYPGVAPETFKSDLWRIINALGDIAAGREPEETIGTISLGDYAKFMTAPHRMDLMISSMYKNGCWNCNNQCLHCYAAGQDLSANEELSTQNWKKIIDSCRKAGIPQLTFTGGEPTLREDLVELVEHAKWFITRLNTNGICLSTELCALLYDASLDSVQVTLYSHNPQKHNALVGAQSHALTVQGIKNALDAKLNVSINTPLCTVNRDYRETLAFVRDLGVRYVTCSGLIPAGGAQTEQSVSTQLGECELYEVLQEAQDYCRENGMDLSFTSPGWVSEARLQEIGLIMIPSCGACLSNMAIGPDGTVLPCQSWLSGPGLGNMLTTPWKEIWNATACKEIRAISAKMEKQCQLGARRQVC